MNAWSKLPNAKHINAVVASVKANPNKWGLAWRKAGRWTEARNTAYEATVDAVRKIAWAVAGAAVWDAAAQNAVRVTVLALVAYDDCAHLLTTNPEHVKMLAGIGNEAAILLYPASLVFSEMKNDCLV